jgi:hypothetical protein
MLTGPFAFGFIAFPVSPPLNDEDADGPLEVPLPPQAARARSPAEDRATNGVLSLMYAPFTDSSTRRRLAEWCTRAGRAVARAGPRSPGNQPIIAVQYRLNNE